METPLRPRAGHWSAMAARTSRCVLAFAIATWPRPRIGHRAWMTTSRIYPKSPGIAPDAYDSQARVMTSRARRRAWSMITISPRADLLATRSCDGHLYRMGEE